MKLLHILICYNYREHLNTLVLKVVALEYILAPSFGRMHPQAVEEISALLFNRFFCIDNCFHNDLEKLKVWLRNPNLYFRTSRAHACLAVRIKRSSILLLMNQKSMSCWRMSQFLKCIRRTEERGGTIEGMQVYPPLLAFLLGAVLVKLLENRN